MPAYQNFLTVLGWSLLDSIWQMATMWIAYNLLTAGSTRISSAGKHNLVLLFVFLGTEWFVYTLIHLLNEPAISFGPGFIPVSPFANRWIPYLSSVYLAILAVRFFQYSFQYYSRRKNESGKSLSPSLQTFTDRYIKLLGIPRQVQVYLSDLAETAETSGFLKPLILLPVSLVTQLSQQQVEAILVHELYHIRRNDYLINICMSCFRRIFFFNPFAHLFYKALARERELACDDGVLEIGFAPGLYAEALFCLEKFRQPQPGFSLAADGNQPWLLMERIQRVLGKPVYKKNRLNPLIYFSLVMAVALFSLQPKKSIQDRLALVSAKPVAVSAARYAPVREKIRTTEKQKFPGLHYHRKPVKTENLSHARLSPEPEPAEETVPQDQAFFADNNIVTNFSNQQSAELSQDPIQGAYGTPFVPSASLSYDARPVVIAADSIRNIIIQNGVREIINLSNLRSIANLKEVEIEMDKCRKEINQIEIKNQKLFLLDKRNIKPLLKKMQKQIEGKKKQIDRLRIQLQDSEEEIIHI